MVGPHRTSMFVRWRCVTGSVRAKTRRSHSGDRVDRSKRQSKRYNARRDASPALAAIVTEHVGLCRGAASDLSWSNSELAESRSTAAARGLPKCTAGHRSSAPTAGIIGFSFSPARLPTDRPVFPALTASVREIRLFDE